MTEKYAPQEFELPSGVKVEEVNPSEMAELLKKAPALVRWPFYETFSYDENRMNVGASSCLMVYTSNAEKQGFGHFNQVLPPNSNSSAKEIDEYTVYTDWLRSLKQQSKKKGAVVILFGQHMSNLQAHASSSSLERAWQQKRSTTEQDILSTQFPVDQVIDLRGEKLGSTALVYDADTNRLCYCSYAPVNR